MHLKWTTRLALLIGTMMLVALLSACAETASEQAAATVIPVAPSPTASRDTAVITPTSEPQDVATPTVDDGQQGAFHATTEPETVEPATSEITPTLATATVPVTEEPDNPAPELASTGAWYNSEPLTLAELRGQPVLLVFWATY